MPVPRGTIYKIKTYASGKRVRLAIWNGRVLETKEMPSRRQTGTQKHLSKTRSRAKRRIKS